MTYRLKNVKSDDVIDLIISTVDQALDAKYSLIEDIQILVPMYRDH